MIQIVRVDERLIHGQVATKILKTIQMDTILVIDDETAADDLAKKTIQMAVVGANLSSGVKTVIKNTDEAIRQLNDPRAKGRRIAIVIRNLHSLQRLVNEVEDVDNINIGIYGNVTKTDVPRKVYAAGLSLNEEEKKILKEIAATDKKVYFRLIPDQQAQNIRDLLK